MDLAIALLILLIAYYLNWRIGHKPINLIHIWHLVSINKKSRK
jgi:hypothetical protein